MTTGRFFAVFKHGTAVCFLAVLSLMVGCQPNSWYHHSLVFDQQGWDMNDTLRFADTLTSSTPLTLNGKLTLRHTNAYPYQNLWLYITTHTDDSLMVSDSINWTLAKPDGNWLGTGWGSLYTISYDLPTLTFSPSDSVRWFEIELVHGLRDSLLTGLSDIGLRLYTKE
jgi:gliding motility-associated lipoprotein GldH